MSENKCNCPQTDEVRDLTQVQSAVIDGQNTSAPVFDLHPDTIAAQISACVSATYNQNQICVHFPVIGNVCFHVNLSIPNGSTVKVCMETCGTTLKPPFFKGLKASVSFNGKNLWSGVIWGHC